jgi:hypothetical protein
MPEKLKDNPKQEEKPKPRIDPSTSPYTEHNLEAARELRVSYSPRRRCYVDEDGCPQRDRFGQPLG